MFTAKQILGKVAITVEEEPWNRYKSYDKLTIVQAEDYTYISRKPVPPLIDIHNRKYWIPFVANIPEQEQPIQLVQGLGNDTTVAVSQAVITQAINELRQLIQSYHPVAFDHNVTITPLFVVHGIRTVVTVTVDTKNNVNASNISVTVNNVEKSKQNTSHAEFQFMITQGCEVEVLVESDGYITSKRYNITEAQNFDTTQFYLGLGETIDDIKNNMTNAHFISNNSILGDYSVSKFGNNDFNYLYLIVPRDISFNRVTMSQYAIEFSDIVDTTSINNITYSVYKSSERFENDDYNLTIE